MTVPTTTSTSTPYAGQQPPRRTVADLVIAAELGDEALQLLASDDVHSGPREFISILSKRGMFPEAVRFLAFALPKRECVWWAWVCARKASGAEPAPSIRAALEATERWIVKPTDAHRREAMKAAEAADLGTPAGCAALAVFFTGGSMAPPNVPAVAPGEFSTAKAVTGTIILAAVSAEPARAADKFREYLKLGLEVAERITLWPASA
jgi:uncharacterized protein DUF6931